MDARPRLDHALALLSAAERTQTLDNLLAALEARAPGAGSQAFDRARQALPRRQRIAPPPAAVLSRLSKDIFRQAAQLHQQATGGVRQLQQGGAGARAAGLPAAIAPALPTAPAVRPPTRRQRARVLLVAAVLIPAAWLAIALVAAGWTRGNLATAPQRRDALSQQITTFRTHIRKLQQRLHQVKPRADATQQAETQRADLARQVETLRQQTDVQTAERTRLQGLPEELKKEQAQADAQQTTLAKLDQQRTNLQAKLDTLHLQFPLVAFAGTRAGQERDDNGLKLKLRWCPPGSFTMGSPASEPDRHNDENQVSVTLSQGFWLGKYEVTQREWQAVMGTNPSGFSSSARLPVEMVSWEEASEFCRKLTEQERKAGRLPADWEYRLPTEAEWEYACRAGTTTATAFGDQLSSQQANFDGNHPYNGAPTGPYFGRTAEVGSYAANARGLHDMHGNVWEWCRDWYSATLPGGTDPEVTSEASDRVLCGGSWINDGRFCRSANRSRFDPDGRIRSFGFRVAGVRSGS